MDHLLGMLRRSGCRRTVGNSPGHRRRVGIMRELSLLIAAVVLTATSSATSHAQVSSPVAPSTLASYPELLVRATDDALELPSEVPAGRYLITLQNDSSGLAGAYPITRPEGVSAVEMQAGIQEAIATPEGRVPDWFYQSTAVGGPFAPPGGRSQVLVDLVPGSYGVLNSGPGIVVALEVTQAQGATPVPAVEPVSDLAIEMQEYAYLSLSDQVAPGPQVWAVTTTGDQPHELALLQAPDGTTVEEVFAVLAAPPDATPAPGELSFMDLAPVGGVGYLSPGQTAWGVFDLAPGTYVALCFVPDLETGMPHAAMGMITVFTVGDGGTPVAATPSA